MARSALSQPEALLRRSLGPVVLCFLVLLILPNYALGVGNCSSIQAPGLVVKRDGFQMEVTGPNVTLKLLHDGEIVPDAFLTYYATVLVERSRVIDLISGGSIGFPQCSAPLSPLQYNPNTAMLNLSCLYDAGGCTTDPLVPSQPGVQCPGTNLGQVCGDLLSYATLVDMDCWTETVNVTLEGDDALYHLVETVRVHFSDPVSNLTVTALYQMPYDDFVYYPPVDNNVPIPFHYYVGSVKVQYDIRNYSWVGPNYSNGYSIYNNSFLALWSTTTYSTPNKGYWAAAAAANDINMAWLNYTSNDGSINITLGMQGDFIIDDAGILGPYAFFPTIPNTPWNWHSVTFSSAYVACFDGLQHFDHWVIDPTLGVLFSGTDAPPGSPPSNSKAVAIGLAVTFTLLVVAAVSAIAILSLTHAGFRNLVRPFFKRNDQ